MQIDSWIFELTFVVFFILMLREAFIVMGRDKALIFLWGSLLWTGTIENLNVVVAGYDYYAYVDYYAIGDHLLKGYSGYTSWMLFVPLVISLGWFILSVPALVISIHLLGEKHSIWLKAALAALVLVSFDVMLDPIAVVNEWWRWTMPGVYIQGVPIANWFGWFFLLFFFGAIYERTVIQMGGFSWLKGVEKKLFGIDSNDLSSLSMRKVGHVFYFRLAAYLPVFAITLGLLSFVTTALWNNNNGPYNSVFPPGPVHNYYSPAEGE